MPSIFRSRLLLPLALGAVSCAARAVEVDFSHQIVPILREHCADCHTGDKKKGGFSMNDRTALLEGSENGPVVAAGKSAGSKLMEVLASDDPEVRMPPKGKRVEPEQIAKIKAWIDEGLAWEEGFAFKKPAYEPPLLPRMPELPPAMEGRTNPVDRILDAYLAQHSLPRAQPLDDEAFLRRASLDLNGLLPTSERWQSFVSDPSPNKRAKLVNDLLNEDAAYAEHWLTFWNDLLRNDYSGTGFITGGRKQISKWLYDSLITNKPFDQFARELIAPPNDDSRGYIDGIKWRGDVSAGQTVEIQFAQSVSQSFLGINMKCASCHDSFIDRWKLDEAYGLAAVYSNRPLEISRCDKPTGRQAVAGWLFPEIGNINPKAPQPERLQQLAALMTSSKNGRFTRTIVNRLWQRLMGRGIVHPVDAMQTEPWSADLLDFLASDLAANGYDLKHTLKLIATSAAYQSKAQAVTPGIDDHGYTYQGPRAKRMTAEQFVDAVWQITGAAPAKIDAPVLRGKPDPKAAAGMNLSAQWIWGDSAKDGKSPPSGEIILLRRTIQIDAPIARAAAAVTCDNGFTLFVNGRSVGSGSNWNSVQALPLQSALKEGANSIVAVASNAGSGPNAAGFFFEARIRLANGTEQAVASDASWQWHAQKGELREGRLGKLPENGWQPVVVVKALPVWSKAVSAQAPGQLAAGLSGTTRMTRAALMKSDFLMRSLGRPNRDQIVSMRPNDLTTLEAIDLSNGAILADTLHLGAQNLLAREWPNVDAFVQWLYHHALSRNPHATELAAAKEALGSTLTQQGVEDALWAVCMLPEFQLVR